MWSVGKVGLGHRDPLLHVLLAYSKDLHVHSKLPLASLDALAGHSQIKVSGPFDSIRFRGP